MKDLSAQDILNLMEQEDVFFLYLYTPLCGTCQVAGKMLEIVEKLFPNETWGKCDLNYIPNFALEWEIESVPCLLLFNGSHIMKKVYAFHSVPYLYEIIKETV
ncbi:thioredoxin-like protein YusE [Robertmurraya siralis]|uniref:Thioredoxin-like protein YusE n=1 Tax=Robertmurraya siralis TaxID=77777 RepID=A0A919WI25_9BACI|nr:thioredoxin family protein [Robertmurraya siralis]PAE19977.1 thiol reductase thioredoxin [Bacillus sp. 7504-2]GIN62112.1 thioredoxin-like protein YusE [Robertmurraya siralis]